MAELIIDVGAANPRSGFDNSEAKELGCFKISRNRGAMCGAMSLHGITGFESMGGTSSGMGFESIGETLD